MTVKFDKEESPSSYLWIGSSWLMLQGLTILKLGGRAIDTRDIACLLYLTSIRNWTLLGTNADVW